MSGSKTITRTFSLKKDLLEALEKEAKSRGLSTSALLNHELHRCDRLVWPSERTGALVIARETLAAFIEPLTVEQAYSIGVEAAPKHKTAIQFLLAPRESLEGALNLLEFTYGNYAKWFKFNHTVTGKDHTILLNHTLGMKWSSFLRGYFTSFFQLVLDLDVTIQYTDNTVIAEFKY